MKNKVFAFGIALALLAGAGVIGARAQENEKKTLADKTGVIEIIKADEAKKEKYDTILLKVGEETFKLLPAKDKKLFKGLEAMGGKTVTVKGELLSAKPPKYPLAAIKVDSFSEAKAAPAKAKGKK